MVVESEKYIEKKFGSEVKKLGGLSIKLLTTHFTGLPDRICLLPGAKVFFVELKTTKKEPSKIQIKVHGMLRKLGFEVLVIDTSIKINKFIEQHGPK